MNLRSLALGALIVFGCSSVVAFAEGNEHHHGFHPQSFTEDSTRTYADGKVLKRHVEQTASANGFTKTVTMTNPEGQTATRKITVSFDKSAHSWSRSVQGTNFDGKTYTRSMQGQGEGFHGHHHGGFEGFGG